MLAWISVGFAETTRAVYETHSLACTPSQPWGIVRRAELPTHTCASVSSLSPMKCSPSCRITAVTRIAAAAARFRAQPFKDPLPPTGVWPHVAPHSSQNPPHTLPLFPTLNMICCFMQSLPCMIRSSTTISRESLGQDMKVCFKML